MMISFAESNTLFAISACHQTRRGSTEIVSQVYFLLSETNKVWNIYDDIVNTHSSS